MWLVKPIVLLNQQGIEIINLLNLNFTNMKKTVFFIMFFIFGVANAQHSYDILKDIPYYENTAIKSDLGDKSECALDLYYPKDKKDFATIVWFHGGGLIGGKKEIPKELMNNGYAVVSVGYRLSPKVKAPVYIEDAAAAVAWVFENIANYGGSKNLIFVSGHSAGAYLGLMITLDKKYLDKFKVDADNIAGLIAFSGQVITHFTIREEKGFSKTQTIVDQYAPLFHVREIAPPILLITGDAEKELLGRYEENLFFWRMMTLAGHKKTKLYKLDGFNHVGMSKPAFPLLLNEVSRICFEKKN